MMVINIASFRQEINYMWTYIYRFNYITNPIGYVFHLWYANKAYLFDKFFNNVFIYYNKYIIPRDWGWYIIFINASFYSTIFNKAWNPHSIAPSCTSWMPRCNSSLKSSNYNILSILVPYSKMHFCSQQTLHRTIY